MAKHELYAESGGSALVLKTSTNGDPVVVPDAHLLFTADFQRSGNDLILTGKDGQVVIIENYFALENPPHLQSPEGAHLFANVAKALAGPLAPGQYAQAGAGEGKEPIGQVETLEGKAYATRTDGTKVELKVGDPVFQGDVVETGADSKLGITFIDQTVFSLSEDARMVLDELVFDPGGSDNSMLVNLVQGSFVFVAGQVAPTGDMKVQTPVATMGIRGTTVIASVAASDGTSKLSLATDPDGQQGAYTIFDPLTNKVLASVESVGQNWVITPTGSGSEVIQIAKSSEEIAQDQVALAFAFRTFSSAQERFANGSDNSQNNSTPGSGLGTGTDPNAPGDLGGGGSNEGETGGGSDGPEDEGEEGEEAVGPSNTAPFADAFQALILRPGFIQGTNEDTDTAFGFPAGAPFAFRDVDPGDALSAVTIVTLPAEGFLYRTDGQPVVANSSISAADIDKLRYSPNGEFEALSTTQSAIVEFTYTVSDLLGATSGEATAEIVIAGVNDAPVAVDDTGAAQENQVITIDVLANDTDVDSLDNPTLFSLDSASVEQVTVTSGTPFTGVTLADLNNPSTGVLSIIPNPVAGGTPQVLQFDPKGFFDQLDHNETATVRIVYTMSDDEAAQNEAPNPEIILTVTGVNDGTVLVAVDVDGVVNDVAEAANQTPSASAGVLQDSGAIDFSDPDLDDTPEATITNSVVTGEAQNGSALTLQANQVNDIVAAFSIENLLTNTNTGRVTWDFSIEESKVDFLGAGESVTAVFTLTFTDDQLATVTQDVTIVINGAGTPNDAPVITVPTGADAGAVADQPETVAQDPTQNAGNQTVSDTINFADVDLTDRPTVSEIKKSITAVQPDGSGGTTALGLTTTQESDIDAAFSAVLGAGSTNSGTVVWTFNIDETKLDFLAAGEVVTGIWTVTVTDDEGATDSVDITVTITGANDHPVISVGATDSAAETLTEGDAGIDVTRTLSVQDLDITDVVNASVQSVAVVSGDDNGIANNTLENMMSVVANPVIGNTAQTGTITWTFDSSPEAFNHLALGESLILDYTIEADDGTAQDTQVVRITIDGTNDDPVNAVQSAAESVDEDTALVFNAANSNQITVSDVDINANDLTVELNVSNGTLTAGGNAAQQAALTSLTPSNNGATLTLVGSAAEINAVLDGLSYQGNLNYNGADTLQISTTDEASGNDTDNIAITVNAVNDAPIVDRPVGTNSVDFTDSDLTSSILVGNGQFGSVTDDGFTVELEGDDNGTFELIPGDDFRLLANNSGDGFSKIRITRDASTVSATGSKFDFVSFDITDGTSGSLRVVGLDGATTVFTGTIPSNFTGTVDLALLGVGAAFVAVDTIRIEEVSVGSLDTSGNFVIDNIVTGTGFEVNEDAPVAITGLSVSDVDVNETPNAELTVTLEVTEGTLTVLDNVTNGLISSQIVPSNGGKTVTLTGTLSEINTTLAAANGVTYQGDLNFNDNLGTEQLSITVNDQGNTGTPGPLTDTETIGISVNPVNDAPVNAVGQSAFSVDEDTDVSITGLSISDVDEAETANAQLSVELSVSNGTINVVNAGSGSASVSNNQTGTVTISGTLADINATLAAVDNIVYRGTLNFNGIDHVSITTNDGGNTGSDPNLTGDATSEADVDTNAIAITVNAVNDAPVLDVANVGIQAAQFGGNVTDFTIVNPANNIPTGDFAVSFFVNDPVLDNNAVGNGETYISYATSGSENEFAIHNNVNGLLVFVQGTAVNTGVTIPQDNALHSVIVNYDSTAGTVEVFLDGVSQGVTAGAPTGGIATGGALVLGQDQDNVGGGFEADQALNGQLADIGFYDTQLTASDIDTIVQGGNVASPAFLLEWNATTGAFEDVSGNGNTMTTNGSVTSVAGRKVVGNEDTPVAVTGIQIGDVDVGETPGAKLTVEFDVAGDGTVTIKDDVPGGLTAADFTTANGIGLVIVTGTLAQINATLADPQGVTYLGDLNDVGADQIQITVSDQGNTGSGGAQLANALIDIALNPIADAPQGTDKTVTINEDTPHTFSAADFGFSDPNDSPPDAFAGVKISTLPTEGQLLLNAVAVSLGDVITAAQIANSEFTFAPDLNENGTAYTTFDFQVQDNNTQPGITEDQSPNTITFDVTPVNDAPEATVAPTSVSPILAGTANDADGPDRELNGATGLKIVDVGGTAFAIVTGTLDNGVSALRVNTDGTLIHTSSVNDNTNLPLEFARAVESAEIGGTTYVFVAGRDGDGIGIFSLDGAGLLTPIGQVLDDNINALNAPRALEIVELGGVQFLLATGGDDNGISVFEIGAGGSLIHRSAVFDGGALELEGALGVQAVTINGSVFVYVAGNVDSGISVFELAAGGGLTPVQDVPDAGGLQLGGVRELAAAEVGGTHYLFAVGEADNGVSVFSIAANGQLNGVFNLSDTPELALNTPYGVVTTVVDGTTFLMVAGRDDDGVSIFKVENNGSLTPAATIFDDLTANLDGPRSIDTVEIDGTTFMVVTGRDDHGVTTYSLNGTIAAVEDTSVAIDGISIADLDVNETANAQLTVTLDVNSGNINIVNNGSGSAAVANNNSGLVTITGSLADINATLVAAGNITYQGNLNVNGTDQLTVTVNDQGNTGSGGAQTGSKTIDIIVAPVNDAPVLTDLVGNTYNENASNAAFGVIDNDVTLTDVDSTDFAGGNLTFSYDQPGLAEDQLAVLDSGSISISGSVVSFNGTAIGTVSSTDNGVNGANLVINFDQATAPTVAQTEALIEAVAYQNISDTPTATRDFSITIDDGDGGASTSVAVSRTITVNAENDAPVATAGTPFGTFSFLAPSINTETPTDVELGDLNGDGILDLFVAGGASGASAGSSVFFGQAAGDPVDSGQSLGTQPANDVELADLNGDGHLDAFVAMDNTAGNSQVFLNNGSGVFASNGQNIGIGGDDVAVDLADLDGDGDIDALATGVQTTERWINNGAGQFTVSGFSSGESGTDVKIGDLDGDGDQDAFVAGSIHNQIWLNNGSGIFSQGGRPGNGSGSTVALGDLDGDGDLDIFLGTSSGSDIVFLQTGTNTGAFNATSQTFASSNTADVELSDVDNDGDLDAVVVRLSDSSVVLLNDGTGQFTDSGVAYVPVGATDFKNATVGDFSGDGAVDILFGSGGSTRRFVNQGTSSDLDYTENDPATAVLPQAVVSDVDSPNLVGATIQITGNYVQVEDVLAFTTIGPITGNFVAATGTLTLSGIDTVANYQAAIRSVTYQNTSENPSELQRTVEVIVNDGTDLSAAAVSQINVTAVNDAPVPQADTAEATAFTTTRLFDEIDAVIVNNSGAPAGTNITQILTNNGSGTLTETATLAGAPNNDVKLADFDNDGDLDALTGTFQYLENQNGTLVVGSPIAGNTGFTLGLAVGDLDGDGDVDALSANWQNNAIQILTNQGVGSGTLVASSLTVGGIHNRDIAVADVNGDGHLDAIVVKDSGDNQLLINNGTANPFTTATTLPSALANPAGFISADVVFADVDGDGDQDALIANHLGSGSGIENELLRNDGSGNFTAELLGGGSRQSSAIAAGDLNGDGHVDLIVTNIANQANQVLINDGTGSFTAQDIAGSNGASQDVALADVNGDGHLDAIITNNGHTTGEANQLLINDGSGSFTVSTLDGGLNASNAVAFGDLDGSGTAPITDQNGLPNVQPVFVRGRVSTNDNDVDTPAANLTYALVNPVDGLTMNTDGSWVFDTAHSTYASLAAGAPPLVVNAAYTVSDGIAPPVQSNLAITVTGTNDRPQLTGLDGATFLENTVTGAFQTIDADVSFADVDSADLEGGHLLVSYVGAGLAEDQLGIVSSAVPGSGIERSGTNISFNGVAIGSLQTSPSGLNGSDLVVSFDRAGQPTVAAVEALIEALGYSNNSDTPTGTRTLSITVNDGDGGTSVAQTATLTVTPENDAPTLTAFAAAVDTVDEDNQVEITVADLSAQGNEADADGTVDAYVVQAVSSGTLLIGANAGTATAFAAGSNDTIDGTNNAYWTPDANANGTLNAFTVLAQDDGGLNSSGAVQAQVTVNALSDAPAGADNTISLDEDSSHTFSASEFGFSDPNDTPADTFTGVVITTLPGAGTLTNDGTAVTAGTFVSKADIDASKLVFTPLLNENGTSYASLTFQVRDSGTETGQTQSFYSELPAGWNANSAGGWGTTVRAPGSADNQTEFAFTTNFGGPGGFIETVPAEHPNAVAATGETYTLVYDLLNVVGHGNAPVTVEVFAGTTSLGSAQTTLSSPPDSATVNFTTNAVQAADNGEPIKVVWTAGGAHGALFGIDNVSLTQTGGGGANLLVNGEFGSRSYFTGENTDASPNTITFDVNPLNDAPTLSDVNPAPPAFLENTVNAGAVAIDTDVTLTDVDSADLNGGNLTVTYSSGGGVEDQLSVIESVSAGNGIELAGATNTTVTFNGTAIGTITGNGVNGADLVVSFNQAGQPSVAAVEALIEALGYANTEDNPAANRTISITVNDGDGGTSVAQTSVLTVTPEPDNVAPVIGSAVSTSTVYEPGDTFGSDVFVNTSFQTGSQGAAQLGVFSDGSYLVAYRSAGDHDGDDAGVYFQRYNADGTPAGGEVQVNTHTTNTQEDPTVAVLQDDTFVVAWMSNLQDASSRGVFAQRFNSSGTKLGGEFRVNDHQNGGEDNPNAATLSNGHFVVTYTENNGVDGSGTSVQAKIYNASGGVVQSSFTVNETTAINQSQGGLVQGTFALTGGGFVALYTSAGDGVDAFGRIFDNAGANPSSEFTINTTTAGNQYPTGGVGLSDGGFIVVFQGPDGSSDGIFAQRFNASGQKVSRDGNTVGADEFQVNDFTANNQYEPVVAELSDGGWAISYSTNTGPTGNGGVAVKRYDSAGNELTSEFLVDDPAATVAYGSDIIARADGTYIVAFTQQDADGAGVYHKVIDPTTTVSGQQQITGTIDFTDGNTADGHTVSETPNGAGYFGTFQAQITDSAQGDGAGQITWTFDVDNVDLATLEDGEQKVQSYTVTIDDGNGGTVDQIVTITLEGTKDNAAPVAVNDAFGATLQSEIVVNEVLADDQRYPDVVQLSGGNVIFVWESRNAGNTVSDLKMRILDAAGNELVSEQTISSLPGTGYDQRPRIAELTNGNFAVSWTTENPSDGSGQGIRAAVFDPLGNTVVQEYQVNNAVTNSHQQHSDITGLTNGGYLVTWMSDADDGSGTSIRARGFDAGGTANIVEFRVNVEAADNQTNPSVAALTNGQFAVVYSSANATNLGDSQQAGIVIRVFFNDGTQRHAEFIANNLPANTVGNQTEASVAALDGGGFIVLWRSGNPTDGDLGGSAIKARIFDSNGGEQAAEFLVTDVAQSAGNQEFASATQLDNGNIVVTWYTSNPIQTDTKTTSIKAKVIDVNGGTVVSEFLVNQFANDPNTTDDQSLPRVAATNTGGFVITWSSNDALQTADTGYNIKARAFEADGTPVTDIGAVLASLSVSIGHDDILGNDTDANGDTLSISAVDAVSADGATITNSGGRIVYDPTGVAAFQALAEGIPDTDTFNYTVSDGNGGTDTGQITVTVTGVNDAPTLADLGPSVTFLENTVNAAPQIIDAAVTFTDPDNNFDGGTLVVSGHVNGEDTIGINNQGTNAGQIDTDGTDVRFGGTVIGTFTGGSGANNLTVNFNASATSAAVDALIQNLTFANSSDTPTTARDLTITITDGFGDPGSAQVTVNVTPEADNAAPVISPPPAANFGGTASDHTIISNISGLPTGDYTVSFSVNHAAGAQMYLSYAVDGSFNEMVIFSDASNQLFAGFNNLASVNLGSVVPTDGNWHNVAIVVDATTTPGQITATAFIDGVAGTPVQIATVNGSETLSTSPTPTLVFGQDQDIIGGGFDPNDTLTGGLDRVTFHNGQLSAADLALLAAGNVAPSGNGPAVQFNWDAGTSNFEDVTGNNSGNIVTSGNVTSIDGPVAFGTNEGENIIISDVTVADADGDPITLTLSVNQGTVDLTDFTGVTVNDAGGDSSLQISGTATQINNVLDNSIQINSGDFSGTLTLTATADDGNGGVTQGSLDIEVAPVADAPTVSITANGGLNGQFQVTGSDIPVETSTTGSQSASKIAHLDNGGYVITWTSNGQVSGQDVHAQVFDADGNKVGGEIQVNSAGVNQQLQPTVAAITGGFVVGWQDHLNSGSASSDLFFQRYNNAGTPQGGNVEFAQSSLQEDYLAFDSLTNGGFVAVWHELDVSGPLAAGQNYIQTFGADGVSINGPATINVSTASNPSFPAVTHLTSTGGFAAVWSNGNSNVFYQQFNSTLGKIGGEIQLTTTFSFRPSITELTNGNLLLVWEDSTGLDGAGAGIIGKIFQTDGTTVNAQFTINTTTTGAQFNPSVTELADGGFFVVWRDSNASDIFGQRFNASGGKVDGEIVINDATSASEDTGRQSGSEVVTQLDDGSIVVTWTTDGADVFSRILTGPIEVVEDNTFTLNVAAALTDTDGSESLEVTLTGLPNGFQVSDGNNTATSDGTNPVVITGFTLSSLTVTPAANFTGQLTITANATSTETANSATATTTADIDITITAVNDAPEIAGDLSLEVAPGGTETITTADLTENDPDDSGTGLTYTVTTGPANGQLELTTNTGVAITTFTQDDLDTNKVVYVHNGSATTSDSFEVQLADGGEDGAGTDTETIVVAVNAVGNDAPFVSAPGVDGTNLVSNGGFELGASFTGDFHLVNPGETDITNWTVADGNVDIIEGFWTSDEGSRSIDLHGFNTVDSAIRQDIATVAGETYQVTFRMAADAIGNNPVADIEASAAGVTQNFTFDAAGTTRSNMGWETKTFVFTATSTTTTLNFKSLDPQSNSSAALDDVQVFEVAHTTTRGADVVINSVSIHDADAGAGAVVATLTVANGTLNVSGNVSGGINGNGTGTVVLTGTVAEINAALSATNGLTYTPDVTFSGAEVLNVAVDDQGNTGGGAQTVSSNVRIAVLDNSTADIDDIVSSTIVIDDFDDASIGAQWTPVDGPDTGTDPTNNLVEQDFVPGPEGRIILSQRETLRTANEFSAASMTFPLVVLGEFILNDAGGDGFRVLTRSDGLTDGTNGLVGGVGLTAYGNGGTIQIQQVDTVDTALATSSTIAINNGARYYFRLVDDGSSITVTVTEEGNSANSETITANTTFTTGSNFVSFYNGDNRSNAELDEVVIQHALQGTAGADVLIADNGDNIIIGKGGADEVRAGGGDDIIAVTDTSFALLDGGDGQDLLFLDTGSDVDFSSIDNMKIDSIESLDIGNGQAQTLTLDLQSIIDFSQDVNDLVDGAITGTQDNSLVIIADTTDTVNLKANVNGVWAEDTGAAFQDYDVYTFTSGGSTILSTLAIDDDATVALNT